MLLWRLTLGPLLIAVLVGLCWWDYHGSRPGMILLPLAIVLGVPAAGEMLSLFRRRSELAPPLSWVIYSGTLLTVFAAGAPVWMRSQWATSGANWQLGWLAIGLAIGFLLAVAGELRRYDGSGSATANLARSCLAILYIGGMMGFLVQLRMLRGGPADDRATYGFLALVSTVAIVKMSDIGQYTAGRLFGRHKLAPRVSPGKTWEGATGGLVFAVLGAALTLWLASTIGVTVHSNFELLSSRGVVFLLVYPIILAAAGIVGDLTESMLKRDAGVKDSSDWLPGFGGVLDMLDSLLGAAPVSYVFWQSWLAGA